MRRVGFVGFGLLGWAALAGVLVPLPAPLRWSLTALVLGVVPGVVWASVAGVDGALRTTVVGIMLSLSCALLLSEAMAVTRTWSTAGALAGLACLSTLGVGARLLQDSRPAGVGR